jgi:hypothetical protein
MNCLKGFDANFAYDPDGINHEVNPVQPGNPVTGTEVVREVGE